VPAPGALSTVTEPPCLWAILSTRWGVGARSELRRRRVDDREGRPELVRDHPDEVALHLAGRPLHLQRALELLLQLAPRADLLRQLDGPCRHLRLEGLGEAASRSQRLGLRPHVNADVGEGPRGDHPRVAQEPSGRRCSRKTGLWWFIGR